MPVGLVEPFHPGQGLGDLAYQCVYKAKSNGPRLARVPVAYMSAYLRTVGGAWQGARMETVGVGEHVAALRRDGELLAAAAQRAGLEAAVPSCPDWAVRDLLHHVGGVHRWATFIVASGRAEDVTDEEQDAWFFTAPADSRLLTWFRDGHAALVQALEHADPGLECFTFLPVPSALAFWARRQAHETAIHRVDAELAAGAVTPCAPEVAADGIAELLEGFLARPGGHLVCDPPRTLAAHAADTGDRWWLRIGPEGREVRRGTYAADCTLTGSASDLYRLLWNRGTTDAVDVGGDPAVLALWREKARILWA